MGEWLSCWDRAYSHAILIRCVEVSIFLGLAVSRGADSHVISGFINSSNFKLTFLLILSVCWSIYCLSLSRADSTGASDTDTYSGSSCFKSNFIQWGWTESIRIDWVCCLYSAFLCTQGNWCVLRIAQSHFANDVHFANDMSPIEEALLNNFIVRWK